MNEKINIKNYEAFLLDLMEGNISDAQHAELMSFLADHPEIDWEMDELPQLELAETEIDGQFKKSL